MSVLIWLKTMLPLSQQNTEAKMYTYIYIYTFKVEKEKNSNQDCIAGKTLSHLQNKNRKVKTNQKYYYIHELENSAISTNTTQSITLENSYLIKKN